MSPDPYDGSMDLSNPQSLNRYSYVGNNPLRFTDPSGLCSTTQSVTVNADGSESDYATSALACGFWDAVEAIAGGIGTGFADLGHDIAGLFGFGHASFKGSMTPRPSAGGGWNGHYMASQVFQGPGSGQFVAANTLVKYAGAGYGAAVVGAPMAAVGGVAVASGLGGAASLNAVPTLFGAASTITLGIESAPPLPPGWTSEWMQMYGARGGFNWFDEAGGEWRLHTLDSWHDLAHWDYNPWLTWNSPWQNVPR